MTSSQIFIGIGLIFGLAVACQVAGTKLRIPALVLLLPAGFIAGVATSDVNPNKLFGSAFTPMVSLAVAIILFDGGLDLNFKQIESRHRSVVRRLLEIGIPMTWAGAGLFAALLLGLSTKIAIMLGAILIVSGPTVVTPILNLARPRRNVSKILSWEGTVLDPIGAVIGVVVFEVIQSSSGRKLGLSDLGSVIVHFVGRVGVGVLAAAVGVGVIWLLVHKLKLSGVLYTEAILTTLIVIAAATNAFRDESGLIAAVVMGVAVANLPGEDVPTDRPFLKTIVQLVIGLLFISISATVTPASLKGVVGPTIALAAILILVVRPLVTVLATARRGLTPKERAFVGMMDPRGIVAASTAATFTAPLVALKLGGADKLLAATFLVIMLTVLVYGLSAVPAVRALGLTEHETEPGRDDEARPPLHRRHDPS